MQSDVPFVADTMAITKAKRETINMEKITTYTKFIELPFKLNACWEWYPNAKKESHIIFNHVYVAFVHFVLLNVLVTILVNFYLDWEDSTLSLEYMSESLPFIASILIVNYCCVNRPEMYELCDYINMNFKFHSARGLTNITMINASKIAKYFQWAYLSWAVGSVTSYAVVPFLINYLSEEPLQGWFYKEVTQNRFLILTLLRQVLAQNFLGIALAHLSIYFAMHAILLCGQFELFCCSIRNVRFTAILQHGVQHGALVKQFSQIKEDEENNYFFNQSEMVDSIYNYDEKVSHESMNMTAHFDIYDKMYDDATEEALKECAKMHQMISAYMKKLNHFISPLLVIRVSQVTLFFCTLLYGLSREFNIIGVEYLMLVAFDIGVYCYFGNQITLQASQVTTAAFQSYWHTMGMRSRKLLSNIMLANNKPITVKAWGLLPMDLPTFIDIIKTSFSFYTLLSNVNEEKK